MRFAGERGLILGTLPTWGYYVSDVKVLDAESARTYGRWLGARYKDRPNVVWIDGGDRIPTGREEVYRALAQGLREGDGAAHLITSSQCHVLIHLDKIATRQVRATLVNPATGEERDAGTYATGNLTGSIFPQGQTQWFSTPGHWEDAVLILDGVPGEGQG